MYMPSAQSPKRVAQTRPPGLVDRAELRILVVEDNAHVGEFATEALAELGYQGVLTPDAATALAELERAPDGYHIILSDVVMPGMNGVDFAREVGRLYPNVPVILASGYSETLAHDGEHGFHFLQKPFSVEQLSSALQAVIGPTKR